MGSSLAHLKASGLLLKINSRVHHRKMIDPESTPAASNHLITLVLCWLQNKPRLFVKVPFQKQKHIQHLALIHHHNDLSQ